ncbi:MAG: hypothetical protein SFV19_06670 [Rhodospirillaceae bacterium]|nr:hypothetical protein [Rhodospirillaceae bacterium]
MLPQTKTPDDPAKAYKHFRSYEAAWAVSQFSNSVYLRGEAVQHLKESTDLGLDIAQFVLAHHYRDGVGVEQDLGLAYKLYLQSRRQGIKAADYYISCLDLRLGARPGTKKWASVVKNLNAAAMRGNRLAILERIALSERYTKPNEFPNTGGQIVDAGSNEPTYVIPRAGYQGLPERVAAKLYSVTNQSPHQIPLEIISLYRENAPCGAPH